MKRIGITPLIFLFTCTLFQKLAAQNKIIDSLTAVLKQLPGTHVSLKADTNKINILNRLSRQFVNTGNYDTALSYASQALAIASTAGNSNAVQRGLARAYNNKGLVFYYRGNYPEALKSHLAALAIQEKVRDKYGIAGSYNHMGLIHYSQGHFADALKSHQASLAIKKEIGDRKGICASYVNMGNIYCDQGNYPEALKNYFACLNETEKTGDKPVIATCYNNIGSVYIRQNNYPYALKNFLTALKAREGSGDQYGDAMSYINLADIYTKLKQYGEAKRYATKGLELAKAIGALELVKEASNALSVVHQKMNEPAKALDYYKAYIAARDSLVNEENSRKMLKTQMQYQYDKKAAADSVKTAGEKKIVAARLKQEKTQRFALYGGLAFSLIFAIFMVNRFRVTSRQKNIIDLKQKEAYRQNAIIAHQKDLVEGKQKEILDSINYALRIQRSLLASEALLDDNFGRSSAGTALPGGNSSYGDYFVLFRPKDIVSGDFYWASKLQTGEFVLAVADSTGHGVPGAIMSMLNIACLNEAVSKNISSPDLILSEARNRIIDYLKNDGSNEGGKDGMDCSLLSFNFENRLLSYSGANSPVWIVRQNECIELKPDKMPVGKHEKDHQPFTLQTLQLQKGDMVYAFTDGYADQFGGNHGKKFMSKALKDLLLRISSKPLAEQKRILDDTFETWKLELEQVDDVTVFGISIS